MRHERIRGHGGPPRTNARDLAMITVMGRVAPPLLGASPYRIDVDGRPRVLPGSGGVVLSHRVGDPAVGLAGDHIEPGVSIRHGVRGSGDANANLALQTFSCVGNVARVVSGGARGARGVVTGKHGGVDNVLIDFDLPVLRRLAIGDRIQVYAYGTGLRLIDLPGVEAMNLSPRLLRSWGVRIVAGRLRAAITHVVPARLMGSGLGRNSATRGDCDIQLFDPDLVRQYGLASLRFGDLVAIADADTRFGRAFRPGFMTLGVVVHSDSTVAGHGPGVVTLLSGPARLFAPHRDPGANIAGLLGLRRLPAPRPVPTLIAREAQLRARALRQEVLHV